MPLSREDRWRLGDALEEFKAEALTRVTAQRDALREAGDWVYHVYQGVSKSGGSPTPSEWDDALEALRAAVEGAEEAQNE